MRTGATTNGESDPPRETGSRLRSPAALLAELVSINSINPEWDGPGEADLVGFLVDSFRSASIPTWTEEVLPGRSNLYARIEGRDSSRAVLLEAHTDVVSVSGMTIDPFDPVVEDGRLYGRGACDTKGGLASMIEAFRAIREEGEKPPHDIWLAAVIDEEHAFRGVLAAIEWFRDRGVHFGGAVVAEPTSLVPVTANKGVLRWQFETRGVAAHSSRPEIGVNAISIMAELVARLDRHHETLSRRSHPLVGSPTGSIGLIEGGDQVNFVPERCTISLDRRLLPGESAASALAEYERLIEEFPEGRVRMLPPTLSDEAMETPPDSPVVRAALRQLESMRLPARAAGVPFGCDATKLSRAGIPSIIFGPGSIDQAHGAVEWVDLEEVELAFAFLHGFLMKFGS